MELKIIDCEFSVCKVRDYSKTDLSSEYCFIGKTDEECSLVCLTQAVPSNTTAREDHWRAMRIRGILNFSLIGILSQISTLLAEREIGIFAVSTYNTDYILVKSDRLPNAVSALSAAGYRFC